MDFASVVVFLFLYFIRPQDWISGLAGTPLASINIAWALLALIARPGGFSPRALLKTPLDWVLLFYLCWVVYASPDGFATFKDARSLFIFYIVTMMALTTRGRLESYLAWWGVMVIGLAALALGSVLGIDITGAGPLVDSMGGRLVVNTWMHNNPNALGHTVAGALPLIYFALIWKRSTGSRVSGVLLIGLCCWCIALTQSKGSYIVAFVTFAMSQLLGRPRSAQIATLVVALAFGGVALSQLPRMEKLSASEEGIQGRLLVWEVARIAMKDKPYGAGWKTFDAQIRWGKEMIQKATHSSYVQIGAALGYTGLFLYCAVLGCGFRVLLQARTRNEHEERIRRMLFGLIFSFTCSNWLIDRAYHTEFFITLAAISAFHRLLNHGGPTPSEDVSATARPWNRVRLSRAVIGESGRLAVIHFSRLPTLKGLISRRIEAGNEDAQTDGISWKRLGLLDIAVASVFFWGVLRVWDYTLKNFS